MMIMPADRLTTLEIRAAEQEKTIEELSGQIAEQWKVIERLQTQARRADRPLPGAGGAGRARRAGDEAAALVRGSNGHDRRKRPHRTTGPATTCSA